MAAARRRGPAPIASFDHDGSDEVRQPSSPEPKQACQLPEIREDSRSVGRGACGAGGAGGAGGAALAPPERARSHSSPGLTGAAPRIDISRASSSSHHDSRDSSPELALLAGGEGGEGGRLALGFREDGAAELRSSTEELAFLQGAPGPPPGPRRPPRRDSQGSEAALLAVSGRTSRISSVGSQCSAHSAAGRVGRLSVASGASRSPSPHRMLLETSFCGPKPIETDPEACAAAVEECLLEIAKLTAPDPTSDDPAPPPEDAGKSAPRAAGAADARDRREVHAEVTLERERPPPAAEKSQKETRNRQRRARSRERRDPAQPEVQRPRNKSRDIIRIKLKPSTEYEDDDDDDDDDDEEENDEEESSDRPRAARPTGLGAGGGGAREARRSPSPGGAPASRKSSFCSLFKSRETVASPDSPSDALRRKKSLSEGRSRSKSRDRDRAATPSSAGRLRGSVLSLFRTPRRPPASPAAGSRAGSPAPAPPAPPAPAADRLRYYEESTVIHIPLRTPPDERPGSTCAGSACEPHAGPQPPRPASAPQPRAAPPALDSTAASGPHAPQRRTVLPDGSVLIPLRSPTDRSPPHEAPAPARDARDSRDSQRGVTAAVVEPRPAAAASPPPLASRTAPSAAQPTPLSPPSERSGILPLENTSAESPSPTDRGSQKRRERLAFATHVGSAEQIFCTQFSLTKTPSSTSEISESLASFAEERCGGVLRDTRIASPEPPEPPEPSEPPGMPARDSSESEGSGSAEAARVGGAAGAAGDAEARGLVVQESFEDELPYVPTTLPLERPLALPMVPVRERGALQRPLASVERPRAASVSLTAAVARMPPPARAPPAPPERHKLHIRLPHRAQPARSQPPAQTTPDRGGAAGEAEARRQWVDFAEVPERRQPPKRIETLPLAASPAPAPASAAVREPVFSYVEPEECRCECHAQAPSPDEPPAPPAAAGCGGRRSSPRARRQV